MEPLFVLKDEDVFHHDHGYGNVAYATRLTVKIVAFDAEKRIALVGTRYRLLPGGGVENGEALVEAALREYREEVGGAIDVGQEIGWSEDYRAKTGRRQETHYFIARVVGEKGIPETTQDDEQGIQVEWRMLEDAIALLEKQVNDIPAQSYNSCFNVRGHLAVLKKIQADSLSQEIV